MSQRVVDSERCTFTVTTRTSTRRVGARAALSPLNLKPIGSGYADNKAATRQDETLLRAKQLSNLANAYHQWLAQDKTRPCSSCKPVIPNACWCSPSQVQHVWAMILHDRSIPGGQLSGLGRCNSPSSLAPLVCPGWRLSHLDLVPANVKRRAC